jgi:hypothetical protein
VGPEAGRAAADDHSGLRTRYQAHRQCLRIEETIRRAPPSTNDMLVDKRPPGVHLIPIKEFDVGLTPRLLKLNELARPLRALEMGGDPQITVGADA